MTCVRGDVHIEIWYADPHGNSSGAACVHSCAGRTRRELREDTNRRVAWNTAWGDQEGTSVRNSTSSQFLRLGMICGRAPALAGTAGSCSAKRFRPTSTCGTRSGQSLPPPRVDRLQSINTLPQLTWGIAMHGS